MVFVVLVPIVHEDVRRNKDLSNQNGWRLQLKSTTHHSTSVHSPTREDTVNVGMGVGWWVSVCLWVVVLHVYCVTGYPFTLINIYHSL